MKYWVFEQGDIAGPFTPEELRGKEGFGPASMIAPEDKGDNHEAWQTADKYPEFVNMKSEDAPVKKEERAKAPPAEETKETPAVISLEDTSPNLNPDITISVEHADLSVEDYFENFYEAENTNLSEVLGIPNDLENSDLNLGRFLNKALSNKSPIEKIQKTEGEAALSTADIPQEEPPPGEPPVPPAAPEKETAPEAEVKEAPVIIEAAAKQEEKKAKEGVVIIPAAAQTEPFKEAIPAEAVLQPEIKSSEPREPEKKEVKAAVQPEAVQPEIIINAAPAVAPKAAPEPQAKSEPQPDPDPAPEPQPEPEPALETTFVEEQPQPIPAELVQEAPGIAEDPESARAEAKIKRQYTEAVNTLDFEVSRHKINIPEVNVFSAEKRKRLFVAFIIIAVFCATLAVLAMRAPKLMQDIKSAPAPAHSAQPKPAAAVVPPAVRPSENIEIKAAEVGAPVSSAPAEKTQEEQAVAAVKNFVLKNKLSVAAYFDKYFDNYFKKGYEHSWIAEPLHKDIYIVKYRLTKPRKEPILYIFEVNLKNKGSIGALNNLALDLLEK